MSERDFIQGFTDAWKIVAELKIHVYGDEYAWQQLYRVGHYLANEQIKMAAAYFADTEAAASKDSRPGVQ